MSLNAKVATTVSRTTSTINMGFVGVKPVRVHSLPVCVPHTPGFGGAESWSVVCQDSDLSTKHPV